MKEWNAKNPTKKPKISPAAHLWCYGNGLGDENAFLKENSVHFNQSFI